MLANIYLVSLKKKAQLTKQNLKNPNWLTKQKHLPNTTTNSRI